MLSQMYGTKEFDSARVSRDFKQYFQIRLRSENADSRLGPKLISNDLARLYHPPMSLLYRRKVPQLDRTKSGRPFHRGRKFMYRLSGKAIRFIKNTRLDLMDTDGFASLGMSATGQALYRNYPMELRSSIYAPKSLSIAFGERRFPKPRKTKGMAETTPRSGAPTTATKLLGTAMIGYELRNLWNGTPKTTVNLPTPATRSPLSANDQTTKLWNDTRELQKAYTSGLGVKKAESSQEDLQTSPSGQLMVSWDFVSQLMTLLKSRTEELRKRTGELKMAKWEAEALQLKVLEEHVNRVIAELPKFLKEEGEKFEKEYRAAHPLESLPEVQEFLALLKSPEAKKAFGAIVFRLLEWLDKLDRKSESADAKLATEDELALRTQLLLVHEVVEPKSRMTLDQASVKLGVPLEQLMPILTQVVKGLDLVLDETAGSSCVRHRSWKYRGMPEIERRPS